MHFGLYLKNKGIISAEQLLHALEVQLETLVPIGQLALEENMLLARDVFEILQTQRLSPGERFGDLAVEMRLLTRDEVIRLLMLQEDRKRPISEILESQDMLSRDEIARELRAYRESLQNPALGTRIAHVVPSLKVRDAAQPLGNLHAAV